MRSKRRWYLPEIRWCGSEGWQNSVYLNTFFVTIVSTIKARDTIQTVLESIWDEKYCWNIDLKVPFKNLRTKFYSIKIYAITLLKFMLLLYHVSDFSHSDSVLKLWMSSTWFFVFCDQNLFERQIPNRLQKSRFSPKGPTTPKIWDVKLCILATTNM